MQRDTFDVLKFPSLEAYQSDEPGKLRVLIATEEIIGPVRNGGIASTYYHLARGLAAQGHDVTVLFLKGRVVENKTPEHWIEHYSDFGVKLIYLPGLEEKITGTSPKWQWRWLSFYRWLLANDHFDAVHTSEWRGGAFYCLQAKRMGLAFADTLFIVKTSSPYIWNRHYQMRPIPDTDLLAASYAEQKCVEWADIVIGGSAHLLSFMDHIGYQLPEDRCYVQPNIVDFSEVKVVDKRVDRIIGDIVKTRELVFFGRIEPRKGLELFIYALDTLVAAGVAIDRVTFLGKEGERMPSQGGIKPLEFIEQHEKNWPFPVEYVTDLNQPAALSLMCERDMIAAMPSLIENSTMAVYEALVHKIPFVATRVGGTPELIAASDHEVTLCAPDAKELATKLRAALENGQPVVRPAFDNDDNLVTWYGFHRYLAVNGPGKLTPEVSDTAPSDIACIISSSNIVDTLEFARKLSKNSIFAEILIGIAFSLSDNDRKQLEALDDHRIRLIELTGASVGEIFDSAAANAVSPLLIFANGKPCVIGSAAAEKLQKAISARPNDLITGAFRYDMANAGAVFVPTGGDMASQALSSLAYGAEIIAGHRNVFKEVGAFEPYRVAAGIFDEYVGRTIQSGRDLFVIPEPLFDFDTSRSEIIQQDPNRRYLARKPLLENTPLSSRKLLLHNPSRDGSGAKHSDIVSQAHRPDDGIAWLANVEKIGDTDAEIPPCHRVITGFDRNAGALLFTLPFKGELTITIDGIVVRSETDIGSDTAITTSHIEILPLFSDRDRIRIRIEMAKDGKIRRASVAAQRLEYGVYLVTSHTPIYWDRDFGQLLKALDDTPDPVKPAATPPPQESFMLRLRKHLRN